MCPAQVGHLNQKRNDMNFINKAISSGQNVVIVGATGEGKTTDVETIKTFSPSRTFTVEDAGEFRLTEAEFSKVRIVK